MFDLDGYDFSLKNVVTNINDYNKASSVLEKEGNHSFSNDGFPVDIYTSGLKNSYQKKILVIFSGAISKRENKSAPFFSGKNIAKTLDLPLIAISDPTLALSKSLSLSWYAGNEYFKNISVVINNLLKNIQNKYDAELLLVGGSGGGFAVLDQLSLFREPSKKVKALIWNPQTNILNYHLNYVQQYIFISFPSDIKAMRHVKDYRDLKLSDCKDILEKHKIRYDVSKFKIDDAINLLYLQNVSDDHVDKHTKPFIEGCNNLVNSNELIITNKTSNINVLLGSWGEGHAVPPMHLILSALDSISTSSSSNSAKRLIEAYPTYFFTDANSNKYNYRIRSRFVDVVLTVPINWKQNPFNNKNWVHHFMSLRWVIASNFEPQKLKVLLTDFYSYHVKRAINNPYYNNLRGDHTAAERMNGLCKLYSKYKDYHDLALSGIIVRLVKAEIGNLLSESMYREGTNHALMIDISLMNCFLSVEKLRYMLDLNYIVIRANETLLKIFYADGMTRENSISYQEYNYDIVNSFINKLEELTDYINSDILTEIISFADVVKIETKKILGYSLRDDGTYLELGDTFSDPKPGMLQDFQLDSPNFNSNVKELLHPYSSKSGYYVNNGLILYRDIKEKNIVHFGQTIMYGSNTHKQNDELSFCLSLNGDDVFIDPGYSTSVSYEQQEYMKSSFSHSTLNVLGSTWKTFDIGEDSNQVKNVSYTNDELSYTLVHKRIENFIISLDVVINPNSLSLSYSSINQTNIPNLKVNRFVLSADSKIIQLSDNKLIIKTKEKNVELIVLNGDNIKILVGNSIYTKFNSDLVSKESKVIDIFYYADILSVQINFNSQELL
ncbi:heparinase II/III domain-containing protein [Psychrobacter aquimaris]|uniref:heparinase II/III domain-containing protein n=1 Tax=Psychrobacter aquimaris TaxID=292733 RepID=UPI003FD601B1